MNKKDLNNMTLSELKQEIEQVEVKQKQIGKVKVKGTPYLIGANYLIRTVTMIYTGKLIKVFDKELVLINCAWIPETERWANSCKDGKFKEVEPYPKEAEVSINREAILDSFIVTWKLPEEQK